MSSNQNENGGDSRNSHRSLKELVSINAWFDQDDTDPSRFALHADVVFCEERLGGGAPTSIIFKLAVKRCDIIFVLPAFEKFTVDPTSVRSPRPQNPKSVTFRERKISAGKASGRLSLKSMKPSIGGELAGSKEVAMEEEAETKQTLSFYNEAWKRVNENHAWSVDGRNQDNNRLAGPVFDPHNEPRLTIIDGRSEATKANDAKKQIEPVSTIKVRCLREDIDIYDIQFKDQGRQKKFFSGPDSDAKLLAAREFLKVALLNEGLETGDILNDPYAEMVICDVAITVVDSSAGNCRKDS